MTIIIKNQIAHDVKAHVQSTPQKEEKMNVADQRLIRERFATKHTTSTGENIVVEPTTAEQKSLQRKFVIEKKQLKGVASAENSLLVNGKQKNIGRKSHYLLDMLTLDDE